MALTICAAYTIYGAIWRIYLSPIAHLPGPRFAALTFWNGFYYDVFLGGRYTWKFKEYHKRYGPIIRINPYEVHINDPDMYDEMRMFGQRDVSAFDTLDHDKHRMRRETWSPYFSKQSVSRLQQSLIQAATDKFCGHLKRYQAAGKPVVMTYAFATLATHVISAYSFPKGFNLLDKPDFDTEIFDALIASTKSSHLFKHFGWLFPLLNSMPLWVTKRTSPETYLMFRFQGGLLQQTLAVSRQKGSSSASTASKTRPSLMQAIMESTVLPDSEKDPFRVKAEATTAIAAGTITTIHALKTATYHILANEYIHATLTRELESQIPDLQIPPSMRELENLPYLMAIYYETLRVFYGVSHRLQRIFPSRTLQYHGNTIPPGTPISMSVLLIHDNPDIFPDPYAFKPERWLPPKEEGGDPPPFKYLLAFSKGSRACVGMELAKAEILTVLTGVFRNFGRQMVLFETERERDIDVRFDAFNPLPSRESNGLMVLFGKGEE